MLGRADWNADFRRVQLLKGELRAGSKAALLWAGESAGAEIRRWSLADEL